MKKRKNINSLLISPSFGGGWGEVSFGGDWREVSFGMGWVRFLILFLLASCTNFTDNPDDKQTQTVFTTDSLWTSTGNAQLDSMLQRTVNAPQDTNLAFLYYKIGDMYENNDFEKSKEYYLKMNHLNELLNWNRGRHIFANAFAVLLAEEYLTDSALVVIQKAYQIAKSENNEEWISTVMFNMGLVYLYKEWYESALECYMEVLSYDEKINNSKNLSQMYFTISQLYLNIDAIEKAIEYGEKSVALDSENSYSLYSLGKAYKQNLQYEKAIYYFEEALNFAMLENNLDMMKNIYYSMSRIYLRFLDLKKAEEYALQSLKMSQQFGYDEHAAYIALGIVEQMKGNYPKAEEYILKALQTGIEFDSPQIKQECYSILCELSITQRKYSEYIQYQGELYLIEQAKSKETTLRAAEEMSAKYETEKKELEIERQHQIIARQNLQLWMLIGGISVCVLTVSLLWLLLRMRNRRNRILTEMNVTKDKFFSIISHDIKNPALAQRDAIKMLVKNGRLWDIDTLSDYYQELLKSAESEVELVYNLLNWARIQTGRLSCNIEQINLTNLIRNDISLIRSLAEKKNINFIVDVPDFVQVTGDSNMISTIVRNLLTNAIKFTPEGGQVTLNISINNDLKEIKRNTCTISVSDTGIGMNQEQLRNLFSLNSSNLREGTAAEQGSGIGLIVCKEMIEMHKSKLYMESEVGKGSRFWFEI